MPQRHVALAFPMTAGHHQQIVQGILEYARQHGPWSFFTAPETYHLSVLTLRGWPGDGVIADVFSSAEARAARRLPVPVVNLSGALAEARLPRVMNDQPALGHLAAEHLLRCEIRRFAYYGLKGIWYSAQRRDGFQRRLAQEGHPCAVLETESTFGDKRAWPRWLDELRRWMSAIQPPFGVLAVHDNRARMVVEACQALGLVVPHDVAVIGIDDDPLACEASRPTLSSVARDGRQIGYRAAWVLDRLMSGKRPPPGDVLVPPAGVAARESTDMIAVDDPDLGAAVRFIRAHLGQPFSIADLLEQLSVSRRWLEYRFRERFGHSPHEYICEARVERARQMLLEPGKRTLDDVARACGFSGARQLRLLFRRFLATTPAEYRRARRQLTRPAAGPSQPRSGDG